MEQTEIHPPSERAAFVLALQGLQGVGRVIISRILNAFGSYERLLEYPREQVLLRLKGLPRAAELVATLFDQEAMNRSIAEASGRIEELQAKKVTIVAEGDAGYPSQLGGLPDAQCPNLLYAFGDLAPKPVGGLAVVAHPPLSDKAFELAQEAVVRLQSWNRPLIASLSSGFDVAILKRFSGGGQKSRPIALADCGLARLRNNLRPAARDLVRANGLLLSGFDMDHGPFPHDTRERAMQQVALAQPCLFVEPKSDGFEWAALTWAVEHHRPVFALTPDRTSLPSGVHPLATTDDLEWLSVALGVGGQADNQQT